MRRLGEKLILIMNGIFVLLFGYIFIRIIMSLQRIIPASNMKYCSMILLWCVMFVGAYLLSKGVLKQTKYKKIILIAFFVLQSIYVWAVHSQVSSDAYGVNYIAYNFVQGNCGVLEGKGLWGEYLATYTNNIPSVAFVVAIYKFIWLPNTLEQSWLFLSVIAVILSNVSLVFVYKLVKSLISETAAIMSLVLAVPMITLSEPTTILYSDIMALWTTPAALYMIVKSVKKEKPGYLCMAGGLLAFGAWIKPQSMVVMIAICIVFALISVNKLSRNEVKAAIKPIVLFIGMFAVASLCLSAVTNKAVSLLGEGYVERNEMPSIHWIAMGLNAETNGAYSLDDVSEIRAIEGLEEKKTLCEELIVSRLKEMGVGGLALHLDEKLIQGLGRGTFTCAREWRGTLLNEALQAKRIQNWTVVNNSRFDNFTAVWIQAGYLMMLFFSLHSSKYMFSKKNREKDKCLIYVTNTCRIAMIGIALMLCLLERNLRYMYAMIPCMIVLSIYDMWKIKNDWATKKHFLTLLGKTRKTR